MTNKRSNLARSDGEANIRVDQVREKGDTVLKVITRDLHDSCVVLNNSDLRRQEHFGGAI